MSTSNELISAKAATGIIGLDDILAGGLSRGHVFLLEGEPGTGKTTVALHFLLAGARAGERCLYITLSETERELRQGAASHGWELNENIEIFELTPPESLLNAEHQQSLLYSSDLELGEATKQIFEVVERFKPTRVVLDSLSEIRLLAQSSLRYRRQILAIKHYFVRYDATVLLLDDLTTESLDKTVHSVAHGVIRLEELTPNYGAERRRVRIIKYRGKSTVAVTMTSPSWATGPCISAPGRCRTPWRLSTPAIDQRHQGNGRPARWWHRDRFQHIDPGPGRYRQIADFNDLCCRCRSTR
ncbi:ATPase domain-containing protein [Pseudomonas parakoreensis]